MASMTAQELKLDYFQIYDLVDKAAEAAVQLKGQFDQRPQKFQVNALDCFANPTSKNGQPLFDKSAHLAWYRGLQPSEPTRMVTLENQFGKLDIHIGRGAGLLVPTQKVEPGSAFPETLDHYKVYQVIDGRKSADVVLKLRDQFGPSEGHLTVPLFFAVPVEKRVGTTAFRIRNARTHLLIYGMTPRTVEKKVTLRNQFAKGVSALAIRSLMLAAPSIKLAWKAG
jgi:hypothetical protein